MKRINCRRCQYYFVTWKQGQPHGCRAYGFESSLLPSLVVFRSSGSECQLFRMKNFGNHLKN
ncbi:hypothetical protein MNB_SM-3-317 [hydrothermal vent metagenome]|uniref:Uracil-DNA glycosylase n=1 Tax=hydrothermal vent metagenome TaxID=652676 RepID=A0A1W1D5I2_9ZZZZ